MPSISKIRFTNVVYENGEKRYNDDIFEFDGQNGAILLENGGGKTVCIQTALQAIVPNIQMADRKIKNTLLLENSPAHIAIEWIISERPRKYALTAVTLFIKNGDVDSYKYAYEYGDKDDESIEKLPFVIENSSSKRPASKDEIYDYYLKMSQNRMNAKVFTKKKQYSDYIEENFKIIPSEWEKIAEINGAEGGVEAFFDSCKTTAQLVDNLLIPTVEDAMAGEGTKAFADIFEKQRDHLKKSKQLRGQIEESRTVSDKINEYVDVFKNYAQSEEKVNEEKSHLKAVYDFINNEKTKNDAKVQQNKDENEEAANRLKLYNKKKASYNLKILEEKMNAKYEEYNVSSSELAELADGENSLKEKYYNLKNALLKGKIKDDRDMIDVLKAELTQLDKNHETHEIKEELKENSQFIKAYFENEANKLIKSRNATVENVKVQTDTLETIKKSLSKDEDNEKEVSTLKNQNEGSIKSLARDMRSIEAAILSSREKENVKDSMNKWKSRTEEIEKNLYECAQEKNKIIDEKNALKDALSELRNNYNKEKDNNASLSADIRNIEDRMQSLLEIIKEFKPGWFNYDRDSIYLKQETILSQIQTKLEVLNQEKESCIIAERISNRYNDDYKNSEYFTADAYLETLITKWKSDIGYVESGMEFIRKYAEAFSVNIDNIAGKFKYWPVTVITSENDVKSITDKAQKCMDSISHPIFVMSQSEAKERITGDNDYEYVNVVYPDLWSSSLRGDEFKKWQQDIAEKASETTKVRQQKEKKLNDVSELFKKTMEFYEYNPFEHYKELSSLLKHSTDKVLSMSKEIDKSENRIAEIDNKVEALNSREKDGNSEKSVLEGKIQKGLDYLKKNSEKDRLYEEVLKLEEQLKYLNASINRKRSRKEKAENDIRNIKHEIEKIDDSINDLKGDELYNEVSQYEAVKSLLSIAALKKLRENLNDKLNEKVEDRNVITEKIKGIEKNEKTLFMQYKDFRRDIDSDLNIDEDLETKEGDESECDRLSGEINKLKEPLKKKKKSFDKLKSEYYKSKGAYDNEKENYLKQYDEIVVFNTSSSEVLKMLESKKKDIDSKLSALKDEAQMLYTQKDSIDDALKRLDIVNAKESFIYDDTGYEITEEEKQKIPYDRIRIVKEHINQYEKLLDSMKETKESSLQAKDIFIKFCDGNIRDTKLKEMAVTGVKLKDTLSEIEKWQSMMNERILRAIEMAENDMREHDKETQQFINHIYTYLINVYDELKAIPKKTRIKIDETWKEVFIFDVPSWDEKEGRQHIADYIDYIISQLEDEKFKDDDNIENADKVRKEIEKSLQTKQLLRQVMREKEIKVKCRKVTNDGKMRSAPFSWEVSNSWSGGEKWSKNMSLFLGILNYTAEKRIQIKPMLSKKHYRSVIVDNPFGKASSEHVLDPVFFIAEQLGFQIIALTAHSEGKFIRSYFPVVYSLKLRNSIDNSTQIITKEKEIKYAYFKDSDDETLIRMGAAQQTSFLD